jgi:hypothetical protein
MATAILTLADGLQAHIPGGFRKRVDRKKLSKTPFDNIIRQRGAMFLTLS